MGEAMSWKTEWRALSDRIQGVVEAAWYVRPEGPSVSGSAHDEGVLRIACEVADALCAFYLRHHETVPRVVAPIFNFNGGVDSHLRGSLRKMVPELILVRSEIDYILADTQVGIRLLVERAFEHLQRLIVADDDFRQKWVKAFQKGETACEKLGASHLLSHGIWAFKANSEGERTDLVLGEPIRDINKIERVAEGLVLTEWKLVRGKSDLIRQAQRAWAQAERYVAGSLAGFELASRRYIVLVSKTTDCSGISNVEVPGATYQHIGIQVLPSSPSKGK